MSLSDIFGGGGTDQVPTSSTTTVKLPAHIEEGSKQLWEASKPLAERAYPQYPTSERLAPFNSDQMSAFQSVRDMQGQSQPIINQGLEQVGLGAAPVGQEQIDQYMNPYIQSVIDASVAQLNNQAGRDRVQRNASLSNRGSFLNEDRRGIIDNVANEGTNRTMAEMVSSLYANGFQNAMGQANTQKGFNQAAAGQYGNFANQQQQQSITDAAAQAQIGDQRQGLNQDLRNLTYEDFMQNFQYPQQQADWLMKMLTGQPSGKTVTENGYQNVGSQNNTGSIIGGLGTLIGGVGSLWGN